MDNNTIWSLRLGFSGKQAEQINKEGIKVFLQNSFTAGSETGTPAFIQSSPKTQAEFMEYEKSFSDKEKLKMWRRKTFYNLKEWWVQKIQEENYPLIEKMTLFWHNHYVSTYEKVRIHSWLYDYNCVLRKNAFGNFRELTKAVLHTNAMVRYLDNSKNRDGDFNENLSRELLELFTLGVGNYTEEDIKNGAKALAGLTHGEKRAEYRPKLEYNGTITYFGKTGKFKSDEIVDIIFEQKSAPYLITEKLLKWFIYDNPPKELVTYYGDYLRSQDFEIKPLLIKMFSEEFSKPTAGSKIKDPLVYILHLLDELNIKEHHNALIIAFCDTQGMELFAQPNVKGWEGANSWLTTQILLQRNNTADELCRGKNIKLNYLKKVGANVDGYISKISTHLEWKKGNNKEVIEQLTNRLIFHTDEDMREDLENILKYDFDPNLPSADDGVMRLFNHLVKTPEFQLI